MMEVSMTRVISVELSRIIDNPWQTRRGVDPAYIEELAADIQRNGLMQPPAGRIVLDGKVVEPDLYGGPAAALFDEPAAVVQLAIGHNRKAAFQRLSQENGKWQEMPVQIGAYDDQAMARMAWSENAQRKDLSALEEAQALQRAIDDFKWTQDQVGEQFGLNRATVANKLRLLQLPEEILEKLHAGEISERQALALLPLYQLPEPTQKVLAKLPPSGWTPNPERLVAMAADGSSSELLRQKVEEAIKAGTKALSEARFPLDEAFLDGKVRSPRCPDCQLLVKRNGSSRCGDEDCFALKQRLWREKVMAAAVASTGLPEIPGKTARWSLEDFGHDDREHGAHILAEGCPKKRLGVYWTDSAHLENYLEVESAPGVIVACNKGERGRCTCLEAREKALPAAQAEKEAKQQLRSTIVDPAVAALAEALQGMTEGAWRVVVDKYVWGVSVEGGTWETICRKLAGNLIDSKMPYGGEKDLDRTRTVIASFLDQAGIQPATVLPGADNPGDELRRRLGRIGRWVAGLEEEIPIIRAVEGNLQNLVQLEEEFGNLLAELDDGADLRTELERLTITLEDVLIELLNRPPRRVDFEEHRRGLLYTPSGDINFNPDRAETATLRYVAAIVRHKDQQKTRLEALERELRRREKEGAEATT
jgi:ParB/RepB/Spo0J family partition protein